MTTDWLTTWAQEIHASAALLNIAESGCAAGYHSEVITCDESGRSPGAPGAPNLLIPPHQYGHCVNCDMGFVWVPSRMQWSQYEENCAHCYRPRRQKCPCSSACEKWLCNDEHIFTVLDLITPPAAYDDCDMVDVVEEDLPDDD